MESLTSGMLTQALTHPSYTNEHPECEHNQRLEFLGDAILGAVICAYLFKKYPDADEGELTRYASAMLSDRVLAEIGKKFELERSLRTGRGVVINSSILADTVEALIGAAFLTDGFENAQDLVTELYTDIEIDTYEPISILNEYVQKTCNQVPRYEEIGKTGPPHDPTYKFKVSALDRVAYGEGKSRQEARRAAADAYLIGGPLGAQHRSERDSVSRPHKSS